MRRDAPRADAAILEAAIAWQVAQGSGRFGPAEQARFDAWLGASPDHRRVWQALAGIDGDLAAARPTAARAALLKPSPRRGRMAAALTMVIGAGLSLALLDQALPLAQALADHRTGTGQRLTVRLPDQTVVTLNTRSAVDLAFDSEQRAVRLREGEIAVDTGHPAGDPRPFRVLTADGALEALGTRFLVRRAEGGTLLTVIQSAVAARPAACSAPCPGERVVGEGQAARMSRKVVEEPIPAAAEADAWTDGLLVVDDVPLATVVAELARHRPGHLAVAEGAGGIRVSGTFALDDTDRALAVLAASLPVRVVRRTGLWVRIEPRQ